MRTPATTIAETTEAARRMVRSFLEVFVVCGQGNDVPTQEEAGGYFAAALAQAMVDADLTPEQVEAIERTVQRFFE